jgi:hypothetical protein
LACPAYRHGIEHLGNTAMDANVGANTSSTAYRNGATTAESLP